MSDQEINPYALYPDEQMDRRPRYYDGQFLGSADFIDAQRYDIDRRRRHIQATSTPGVVAGLAITDGTDQVGISAGAAVDACGRQIVLVADEQKGVRESDRGKNLLLYIRWGETTSDQSVADQGTSGFTRFLEMPEIDYVEDGTALPEHAILLARLQVDGGGVIVSDSTVRPRAGLRVPGAKAAALVTDDGDPGRSTLTSALKIEVPEGTRHYPTRPALDVNGHGRFYAGLIVGQGSRVGYKDVANDGNDLVVSGQLAAGGGSAINHLGIGYAPPTQGEGTITAQRIAVGRETTDDDRALHVQGKTKFVGHSRVEGDLSTTGRLAAEGPATLSSTLNVSGGSVFGRNVTVGGNIDADGTLNIDGTSRLRGNVDIDSNLAVGGQMTVGGATTIDGAVSTRALTASNTLRVTAGGADITGDVTTSAKLTVGNRLVVTTGAIIGGGMNVHGGVSVGGLLRAHSNITMEGQTLDLGASAETRGSNCGKIKYAVHTSGLEVFGGGTTNSARTIKFYAESGTTFTGGVTASGPGVFSGNSMVKNGGLVVGQDSTTGYGGVVQDGNDLVVNGQFAAGGSGGAAMYSLSVGYPAVANKEGHLRVANRLGIGTDNPANALHVIGNGYVSGHLTTQGTLQVKEGRDSGGIRFPTNIGGGSGDWAALRYWVTDGENTRLELGTGNDPDDILVLKQRNRDMVIIRGERIGLCGDVDPDDEMDVTVHGDLKVTDDIYVMDDVYLEDLSSNLKIGSDHYIAMGYGTRVQIIWGVIKSDQSWWNARGIDRVERHQRGDYTVHFKHSFSSLPAVVTNQHGSGNTRDNCLVHSISSSSCKVKTGDGSGDRSDRAFTIIAIGPR